MILVAWQGSYSVLRVEESRSRGVEESRSRGVEEPRSQGLEESGVEEPGAKKLKGRRVEELRAGQGRVKGSKLDRRLLNSPAS
jgi:hypothetical protein